MPKQHKRLKQNQAALYNIDRLVPAGAGREIYVLSAALHGLVQYGVYLKVPHDDDYLALRSFIDAERANSYAMKRANLMKRAAEKWATLVALDRQRQTFKAETSGNELWGMFS